MANDGIYHNASGQDMITLSCSYLRPFRRIQGRQLKPQAWDDPPRQPHLNANYVLVTVTDCDSDKSSPH